MLLFSALVNHERESHLRGKFDGYGGLQHLVDARKDIHHHETGNHLIRALSKGFGKALDNDRSLDMNLLLSGRCSGNRSSTVPVSGSASGLPASFRHQFVKIRFHKLNSIRRNHRAGALHVIPESLRLQFFNDLLYGNAILIRKSFDFYTFCSHENPFDNSLFAGT